MKNPTYHKIDKEEQEKINCSHDCLKCKHYTRREAYNQQWGMIQFYNNSCNKGHNGKINSYFDGVECNDFEHGENTLIFMSDKEKKMLGVYSPNTTYSQEQVEVKSLQEVGIKYKNDDGTYKSTSEILKEISDKYSN